jgi:hypothetical protein
MAIAIVSGLPRSGTSMMMKMLEAGGMEVVGDEVRKADIDNPKGYYELERVKKIKEDASWLDGMQGKAVKMVSMLLYDLPPDKTYRIIFMKRNIEEILASQRKMLQRRGEEAGGDDKELDRAFRQHLEDLEKWMGGQDNIRVLYLNYNDIVSDPGDSIQEVNRFLGGGLDVQKMLGVVDESLYRNRVSPGSPDRQDRSRPTAEGQSEDKEKIEQQLRALGYM